jgi:hypothetical protein
MSGFDFLFTFYSLLLGLSMVEVVSGFSRALDHRRERPLGVILPMLALVIVFDLLTWWALAWRDDRSIDFSKRYLLWCAVLLLIYYFAATQLFPRERSAASSLDDHFFSHRRWVLGGVILANLLSVGMSLYRYAGRAGIDDQFWHRVGVNSLWFALLFVVLLARPRPVVIAALAALIAFDVFLLLR